MLFYIFNRRIKTNEIVKLDYSVANSSGGIMDAKDGDVSNYHREQEANELRKKIVTDI